jgi:hypothetical protein
MKVVKFILYFTTALNTLLKNDYLYECNIHRKPLGQVMKRKRHFLKKSLIKLPSLFKSGDRIVDMSRLLTQHEDVKNVSFLGMQIQDKSHTDSVIFPKKFQDRLKISKNSNNNDAPTHKCKFKIKPINRTWRDLTEDQNYLKYDSNKERKLVLDKSK